MNEKNPQNGINYTMEDLKRYIEILFLVTCNNSKTKYAIESKVDFKRLIVAFQQASDESSKNISSNPENNSNINNGTGHLDSFIEIINNIIEIGSDKNYTNNNHAKFQDIPQIYQIQHIDQQRSKILDSENNLKKQIIPTANILPQLSHQNSLKQQLKLLQPTSDKQQQKIAPFIQAYAQQPFITSKNVLQSHYKLRDTYWINFLFELQSFVIFPISLRIIDLFNQLLQYCQGNKERLYSLSICQILYKKFEQTRNQNLAIKYKLLILNILNYGIHQQDNIPIYSLFNDEQFIYGQDIIHGIQRILTNSSPLLYFIIQPLSRDNQENPKHFIPIESHFSIKKVGFTVMLWFSLQELEENNQIFAIVQVDGQNTANYLEVTHNFHSKSDSKRLSIDTDKNIEIEPQEIKDTPYCLKVKFHKNQQIIYSLSPMDIEQKNYNHLSFSISDKKRFLILNGRQLEPKQENKYAYHLVKDKQFYFSFQANMEKKYAGVSLLEGVPRRDKIYQIYLKGINIDQINSYPTDVNRIFKYPHEPQTLSMRREQINDGYSLNLYRKRDLKQYISNPQSFQDFFTFVSNNQDIQKLSLLRGLLYKNSIAYNQFKRQN